MFKSNKEMMAEIMPDENTVLILKRELQLHCGVLDKGTRVILRCGERCGWYDVISSNGCCIESHTLFLDEMIRAYLKTKQFCTISLNAWRFQGKKQRNTGDFEHF